MTMPRLPAASRRAVLGASAGLVAAGPAAAAAAAPASSAAESEARRLLERYHSFGDKASGGPGDEACGAWLEGELKAMGYTTHRQVFETPAFEGPEASLTCGTARAVVLPQAIVTPTPAEGLTAPLRMAGRPGPGIAILVLPYARWSTAKGDIARRVNAIIAEGAQAVILVTTGPTGEAIALNTPVDAPLFDRPVAILAPRAAGPFLAAAAQGQTATLSMAGRSFRRPAWNLTATLKRGAAKSLVLSTPRSGWFGCAGERGTGVAVWHGLAAWAAKAKLPVDVALIATSGHEYEYAGGEHFIATIAPKPADTALWIHIGANAAARDWHELGGALMPLPSADPQRFLMASPALVEPARAAFAGLPGLESPYPGTAQTAAGELGSILHAGYPTVMGVFGSHRYHHARADDLRCVSHALIPPVVEGFRKVAAATLV